MQEIMKLLQLKGYKMTTQRRIVINGLFECGQFPTAQDLLEYAKKINPNMGIDTIYRNLNMLTEIGVLNQITIRNRNVSVFEIVTNHRHHHLMCLSCGKIECLDYCPVVEYSVQIEQEKNFKIMGHNLDFYGYCAKCQVS